MSGSSFVGTEEVGCPWTSRNCNAEPPLRLFESWATHSHSLSLRRPILLLAHSTNELMQWRGVRRLSVCLSVNFCTNRFFSQTNGQIATKLSHDGLQVSVHPGCAEGQGQGQRSRDMRTFLYSWNELLRHWRSGYDTSSCIDIDKRRHRPNRQNCHRHSRPIPRFVQRVCWHTQSLDVCIFQMKYFSNVTTHIRLISSLQCQ